MPTLRSVKDNLEFILETIEENPEIENYLDLESLYKHSLACGHLVASAYSSLEEANEEEEEDDDAEEEG